MKLKSLAHTRSGDKGNHANIGVIAYDEEKFEYIKKTLDEKKVFEFFKATGVVKVIRYELPNIFGFNFVLEDCLQGGAGLSPRIDTQGKLFGTALLEIEL